MPRALLLPRADHLCAEPQLATLAVLETTANVAILVLGAEYPELAVPDVDLLEPRELHAAADLIQLARQLDVAIARYRRDLAVRHERERDEDDLLPF